MNGVGPRVFPLDNGSFQGTSDTTDDTAFVGNVGATPLLLALFTPSGLYRADIAVTATALATLAPAAAFNIISSDDVGALTAPILLMNLGTTPRGQGSILFKYDGSSPIQFSITGITTPGPLAAKYILVLTRVG